MLRKSQEDLNSVKEKLAKLRLNPKKPQKAEEMMQG